MPALKEYTCPKCRRLTILDSNRPVEGQKCHLCTEPLHIVRDLLPRYFPSKESGADAWMALDDTAPLPKQSDKWFLKIAIICGAVIFLILASLAFQSGRQKNISSPSPPALIQLQATPYYDAKTLASQVLEAPSLDALLPLFRERAGVREWMAKWRFPIGGRILTVSPVHSFEGHALQRVNLQTESGRHLRLFVENRDGKFLADWPSFVGASDLTTAQLLQQRPTSPVLMRVLVAATDHPVAPFEDPRKWFCIRIFAPGQDESCFGYLALDNPALAGLTKRIPLHSVQATPEDRAENEGVALPLALRVAVPKGAAADQVEVVEVVGSGWFIP